MTTSQADEEGPWFVWGDDENPIESDISYDKMKKRVDELHSSGRDDVYGENNDTGQLYYPGDQTTPTYLIQHSDGLDGDAL